MNPVPRTTIQGWQKPFPTFTRFHIWGVLDEFFEVPIQRILKKWHPRIPAKELIRHFNFVARTVNLSRTTNPAARSERLLEEYRKHPRLFAELMWALEDICFQSNGEPILKVKNRRAVVSAARLHQASSPNERTFVYLVAKTAGIKNIGVARNALLAAHRHYERVEAVWHSMESADAQKISKRVHLNRVT
jgi:hypothetical protein